MKSIVVRTYQTDKEEKYKERTPQDSLAVYITIAHRRHGHNEEIHTCPVG
jgi:hypothetical protein